MVPIISYSIEIKTQRVSFIRFHSATAPQNKFNCRYRLEPSKSWRCLIYFMYLRSATFLAYHAEFKMSCVYDVWNIGLKIIAFPMCVSGSHHWIIHCFLWTFLHECEDIFFLPFNAVWFFVGIFFVSFFHFAQCLTSFHGFNCRMCVCVLMYKK